MLHEVETQGLTLSPFQERVMAIPRTTTCFSAVVEAGGSLTP